MGRWTYYSPALVGLLLVLGMQDAIRQDLATWLPAQQWTVIIVGALLFGLQCQVLMVGAQGAFAQVLPAPGGRSIRGGYAVAGGWLLMLWFLLSLIAALMAYESVNTAAWGVGLAAVVALATAGVVYFWAWPTAVEDFGADPVRPR
jgi:hypothetical protein